MKNLENEIHRSQVAEIEKLTEVQLKHEHSKFEL
jgi:hypothetical protein